MPLWVFVGGHIGLLLLYLFLPAIDTVGDQLGNATAGMVGTFWGWGWVTGSVRFIVLITAELFILYATAKAFWHSVKS